MILWHHSFMMTDHEIFSRVFFSLLLIQKRQLSLAKVNCLVGLSLSQESVVRLNGSPSMIITVYSVHS